MASQRALTLTNGVAGQIVDANTLVVGSGITTLSGGISIGSSTGATTLSDNVTLAANKNFTATAGSGSFNLSGMTGTFQTPSGVATFNGSQNNFTNVVNANGSGTGLAVSNNATVGGTATVTGAVFANGGVDRSTAAQLNIGTVNANAISIGQTGVLTTVQGNLQVQGTEVVVGTTTFQNNVTFDGNVTIGDGTGTDTLDFNATSGRLSSVSNPNILWVAGANHVFAVDTAAASTNGWGLTIRAGGAGTGNQNGGPLTMDAGALTGSGTGGAISLGAANAGSIGIGRSGITTTVTGNFATQTGTVSLAATGNSGFTTSSGTLNLQGNAAVTVTSTTSTVTVNGNTGLNLQVNSTNLITMSGTTTTVATGTLLQTSGTGNINLPNNSNARFQIEGASVGSTVTAANMNTLTNGSNADSLHTHSSSGGGTSITTTTGEGINQGAPVSMNNVSGSPKSFNAAAGGSNNRNNAIGIALATVGSGTSLAVAVGGAASIPDAIWDSVPLVSNVGQLVYVSDTQGKLTLTPPTTSGDLQLSIGTLIVGGSGACQIVVEKGVPYGIA